MRGLGPPLLLLFLAGCGGPLRLAGGPVESATAHASGPGEVAWSCGIHGDERWIQVDLALENRGTLPVEWPNPAPGAAIEIGAQPDGACVIRVSRAGDAPLTTIEGAPAHTIPVPAGATSHLQGGFAVVEGDGPPEVRWSEAGPSVALAPGQTCRVECGAVYWPSRVGEPPPPSADGSYTVTPELLRWMDPVVPVSASPGEVGVTAARPRRVVLSVDPPAPLPTTPEG